MGLIAEGMLQGFLKAAPINAYYKNNKVKVIKQGRKTQGVSLLRKPLKFLFNCSFTQWKEKQNEIDWLMKT